MAIHQEVTGLSTAADVDVIRGTVDDPDPCARESAVASTTVAVLEAFARGRTTAEVAASLGISPSEVGRRVRALKHEWGAKNRLHLVAMAARKSVI